MKQNGRCVSQTRDPDRTRARILAAATVEFAEHGFAGARIDAIAQRAQGNKRMLYHYFGNKEALFGAVLHHKMAERRSWAVSLSNDPAERLPFWFKSACEDSAWVRLLEWEALRWPARLNDERERRGVSASWLQCIRRQQRAGQLTADFEACYLGLAMQSLSLFPAAFPQLVRLATGRTLDDPKFQSGYRKFLTVFAAAFRPIGRRGGTSRSRKNKAIGR
jgi:AcrR family transcriptional regulator